MHRTYPELFAASRCLVPFTGFYEWAKRSDGSKEPYLFRPAGGPLCSFAGLWMTSAHPDGRLLQTCTVITTKPNAVVAPIHDRMPVILDPDAARTWLYADAEHDELRLLLAPYPDEHLIAESLHTSQQTALF